MPDLKKISGKIVLECLRVRPGENFHISCGDPFYWDFCREIAERAVEIEANPLITASSDAIALAAMKRTPRYLKSPGHFGLALLDATDVRLMVSFPKNPALLEDTPVEKMAASAQGSRDITKKVLSLNENKARYRMASFIYPTLDAAAACRMDYEEYSRMIWDGVDLDYASMMEEGDKIADFIKDADEIRITSPLGSALSFSLKGREIFVDDGVYSDSDIEEGRFMMNLPSGEVCCAPVQKTANGTAVFRYNVMHGRPLRDLRITFKEGRVVDVQADEGAEYYLSMLEKYGKNSDMIAELGIGLNPGINRITGNLALDEKIRGTIHIATGDDRPMGGSQESSFHWDLVMEDPTVTVDGRVMMQKGKFLV